MDKYSFSCITLNVVYEIILDDLKTFNFFLKETKLNFQTLLC